MWAPTGTDDSRSGKPVPEGGQEDVLRDAEMSELGIDPAARAAGECSSVFQTPEQRLKFFSEPPNDAGRRKEKS